MHMEFDRLNKWLTLLSNFAVLIGIVFLIIEVNQNTTEISNEASWARASLATELNLLFVTDPAFRSTFMRVSEMSEEELAEADDSDRAQSSVYIETFMVHFETRFLTQTSVEDRQLIKEGIQRTLTRGTGTAPLAIALNALEGKDYEFQEFARDAINEVRSGT